MKSLRMVALLLGLLWVLPVVASADVIEQTFEHKLSMGQGATSWEHKIDLPENLAAQGHVFNKRLLVPSGRLVVEREELTKTYYYLKVRLPKEQLLPMKGAIKVTVETALIPTPAPVVAACEKLYMTQPAEAPGFGWDGLGQFTNITLFDRDTAKTVWERIIVGGKHCHLDESRLTLYHHYTWAVAQSDEYAKYGPAAEGKFRIGTSVQICKDCNGAGYRVCTSCGGSGHVVGSGPNGQPVQQACPWCHGSGRILCTKCNGSGHVTVPAIIIEN